MSDKKLFVFIVSIAFAFGWYTGYELTPSQKLEGVLELKSKDGELLAFAHTQPSEASIVNLKDGAYVAFPLFSYHNKIDQALS